MKLIYLAANDAYVFTTDGQNIIELKGEGRLFGNRYSAKRAAGRLGLYVDLAGNVGKMDSPKGWTAIEGGETA